MAGRNVFQRATFYFFYFEYISEPILFHFYLNQLSQYFSFYNSILFGTSVCTSMHLFYIIKKSSFNP